MFTSLPQLTNPEWKLPSNCTEFMENIKEQGQQPLIKRIHC